MLNRGGGFRRGGVSESVIASVTSTTIAGVMKVYFPFMILFIRLLILLFTRLQSL